VFKRVRRESPAAYLKVCAMLVPRERDAAANAKVIEGEAEVVPSLPPPVSAKNS